MGCKYWKHVEANRHTAALIHIPCCLPLQIIAFTLFEDEEVYFSIQVYRWEITKAVQVGSKYNYLPVRCTPRTVTGENWVLTRTLLLLPYAARESLQVSCADAPNPQVLLLDRQNNGWGP